MRRSSLRQLRITLGRRAPPAGERPERQEELEQKMLRELGMGNGSPSEAWRPSVELVPRFQVQPKGDKKSYEKDRIIRLEHTNTPLQHGLFWAICATWPFWQRNTQLITCKVDTWPGGALAKSTLQQPQMPPPSPIQKPTEAQNQSNVAPALTKPIPPGLPAAFQFGAMKGGSKGMKS